MEPLSISVTSWHTLCVNKNLNNGRLYRTMPIGKMLPADS
jgi:hypothetical protein